MNPRKHDEQPRDEETALVVASASPAHLIQADKVIRERIARGARLQYAVSYSDEFSRVQLEARRAVIRLQPRGAFAMLGWLRALRCQRFGVVVVLLTGDPSHRLLKAMGLLLAIPKGLILNENGDYCRPTPQNLYRHFRWRLAEQRSRYWALVQKAWRLFRRGGHKAVATRLSAGLNSRGRLMAAIRLGSPFRRLRRISLPRSEKPEVSIVIPARDQWRFTHSCLDSIMRNTINVAYEVILVDDASTDKTQRIESFTDGLHILRLAQSRGFVEACNAGAGVARGDNILFLNNDVTVTPGWLDALLSVVRSRPDAGAVGAKLLFPNGKLQEAGGIVWRDGSAWNYGRFDDPDRPEYNYVREVDYCSGAALLVRRHAFEEVGGFDRAYSPGYWEDTDLCFALRNAGYSIWYQPAAVIFHYEGASSGTDEAKGMKRFQRVNASRFQKKWSAELRRQCEFDPTALFRARDRRSGRTVLVLDHVVPMPDRDAGSSLMYWFLKVVVDLGYCVVFWPQNLFRSAGYTAALQQVGIEVVYGPVSLDDYFEACGRFIEIAIAHHPVIAREYLPRVSGFVGATGYIPADLEHLREERRCSVEGDAAVGARAALLREREAWLVKYVDRIGIHSPVERCILEKEFGAQNVVHLPLPIPRREPTSKPFDERDGMLFVGSTHPPNVDAVQYLIRHVFPRVRKGDPKLELWIVGGVCSKLTAWEGQPGVHLVGYAEDLEPWFERARVFVAPLRYGAGIKGKLLGAMSAGVPIVTTSIGAEGIGLEAGISAFIEDSDEGFAEAVIRLNSNRELWSRIRCAAREIVDDDLSFDRFREAVESMMAQLAQCADQRRVEMASPSGAPTASAVFVDAAQGSVAGATGNGEAPSSVRGSCSARPAGRRARTRRLPRGCPR